MKKINIILITFIFGLCILFSGCTSELKISVAYQKMTMYVGETYVLDTNFKDLADEGKVYWSCSNDNASVSEDGEVCALREGDCVVSARFNNYESSIFITIVSNDIDNRKIEISGTQMVLIGESILLKASADLKEDEYIVWESLNESVASVSDEGEVTGVLTGLSTIRASLSSNAKIYSDITILVRSGSGLQDVFYNYIYENSYTLDGTLSLEELSEKTKNTVSRVKDAVLGVSNYVQSGTNLSLDSVGSAVIYKKEVKNDKYLYTLLTNYHVVEGAAQIKIYIGNDVDNEFDANVIKTNSDYDLAIVTFEYEKELPVCTFGSIGAQTEGDFCIAIGNPNGYKYYNSVTFGIISYVGRTLSGEKAHYLQHDAAINSGNSGGPLFNLEGEIIGINTMKIAKTTVEGMGFAIDLEIINDFLSE